MSIKPPRLERGDGIGIIAPAGPVNHSEVQPSLNLLESIGYRIVPAPHLYQREGYLAGGDDSRLEDLHAMFQNEDVKAIFCARGGYGTLRLLDKINYGLISRNPKMIVGYSDITALLLAIYKKTGLVTFHGPVVSELKKNENQNLSLLLDLLLNKASLTFKLIGGEALIPGKTEGILLGGNLSLISHLIGTPFMPTLKKKILFVEERGEALYRIDRMLTHLRLSGLLDQVEGLIMGRFTECGDISDINQLVMDIVSDMDIPIASGLPVGHGAQNVTLPLGLRATLDTEQMILSIEDAYFK